MTTSLHILLRIASLALLAFACRPSRVRIATLACLAFACLPGRAADTHDTFTVGDFTFAKPASWTWTEPSSSMRKAQLTVKDAAGKETAEVVFFQFEGGAGGAQANIDRWLSQFEEPKEKLNSKIEEVSLGKTKVTYVSAEWHLQVQRHHGWPGRLHAQLRTARRDL